MDLTKLFNVVLSLSLMGSILSIMIILIKGLFKNRLNANWHYYIWLLLVIRLIIPNAPESSLSIFNLLPSTSQSIEISQNVTGSFDTNTPLSLLNEESTVKQSISTSNNNLQSEIIKKENVVESKKNSTRLKSDMISIIWLTGAIVILLYILIINTRFLFRINKQPQCREGDILRRFDECKGKMDVRGNIPIIFERNLKTPSLYGLIKPKLLIPYEIINNLSEDERRYVFLHELAHLKRKDNLINWIMVLVQALHWFNPIVWYAFSKMREDCEVACDAYVLSRLNPMEHKKYGETIINLINTISKPYWSSVTTGMANNKSSLKKRIKMVTMFKKNSWKWSIIAIVIIVAVGIAGLTNSMSDDSPLYKHIDKSTDFDILSLEDNEGNVTLDLETLDTEHWTREDFFQLETRILLDAIKHFPRQEQNYFKKITIRAITEKTERVFYTVSVNGDTLMKNDWTKIESFEVPYYAGDYYYSKNWEQVSRDYRVQGTIVNMDTIDSKLNSIELEVTKRINLPNNPIDAEFTGKTLHIVFNEELMNAGMFRDEFKKGSEIVVTFAQYAIPPDGKVVDGANLREIYYYENGKYYDIRGKAVDVIPASDEEFVTKPQIEVPVDLEIDRFEQQQMDEGHKPWRLDPIQTAITFLSLKISPEGVEGPFPVKEEDIKIIQQTDKVATVEVSGDKTPVSRVYLKRIIRQDSTGIWSVVGYDPKTQQVKYNLPAFNGNVTKIEKNKELKISNEKWLEAKKVFLENRDWHDEIVENLNQSDFKSEGMWKGTLNGENFELVLYQNTPFQFLFLKYGEEERINLLQDFYYTPWVFYGENIRFQQIVKGVGMSYNIISGEFSRNKMPNEVEIFDKIFYDLRQLQENNNFIPGNEIEVGGNKAKLLGGYSLIAVGTVQ